MKKIHLLLLVPFVMILFITGCRLFGPNPDNIMTWLPTDYESGITKLTYTITFREDDAGTIDTSTDTETLTLYDGANTTSREVIMLVDESGDKMYLISDKNQKKLFLSWDDDVPTAEDPVLLQEPVEDGRTWPTVDFFWGGDVNSTILQEKTTFVAGGTEYDDAVQVSLTFLNASDYLDEGESESFYYYYSPSGGMLSFEYTYTDSLDDYTITYTYTLTSRN